MMTKKKRNEFFNFIVSLHEEIHNHDILLGDYYENDRDKYTENCLEWIFYRRD
jgi:hypothetical protein